MQVIRMGHRTWTALGLAAVCSVVAFGWPFVFSPGGGIEHAADAPLVLAVILPIVIVTVLAQVADGGMDTKTVAMLGVLAAFGAGLRPLGAGIAGIEPIFFLLVLAGRVFGPGFGFALGATTLFASALLTGGVGPWLPFQMLAASWVAMGAGLLPKVPVRMERWLIAGYGAVSSFVFGLAMNLSFWPFTLGSQTEISFIPGAPASENLRRFLLFDLSTSLGWDIGRAVTTGLLVILFGRPVLAILRRAARTAAFDSAGEFDDSSTSHVVSVGL